MKRSISLSLILLFIAPLTFHASWIEFEKESVAIKSMRPRYPEKAWKEKIEGQVIVAVLVDVDGKPKNVKVLKSTNEIFNFEALDAARQWLFSPAILNKKPAKFWLHITMDFKLSSKGSLNTVNEPAVVIFGDIFFKSKPPPQKSGEEVIDINPDEYIGGGCIVADVEPVLVQRVEPIYPQTAYVNKVEGQVIMSLLLDVDGKVLEAKVLKSSNEIFNENALVAVKQWVFRPAMLNGKPVKFWYHAPIYFKIE